ncbi:MAG: hypothetical protein PHC61_12335 [Chitinivibrionales bacterium]|nr:hypothetical protein [Chitinivibrionales bacterium]
MKKFYLFVLIISTSSFIFTAQSQLGTAKTVSDSIKTITSTVPAQKLDKRLGVIPSKKTNWSKIKDLFL